MNTLTGRYARQIAAELYQGLCNGPARAPT